MGPANVGFRPRTLVAIFADLGNVFKRADRKEQSRGSSSEELSRWQCFENLLHDGNNRKRARATFRSEFPPSTCWLSWRPPFHVIPLFLFDTSPNRPSRQPLRKLHDFPPLVTFLKQWNGTIEIVFLHLLLTSTSSRMDVNTSNSADRTLKVSPTIIYANPSLLPLTPPHLWCPTSAVWQ